MLYSFCRFLFRSFFAIAYRWKVEGVENIPSHGAVVICSNHIHNMDPPLIGSAASRKVYFMAKEELFRIPILSFFIRRFGAFPVKRGASDRNALKNALAILQQKKVLGIFPEGTRSKTGELGEAHPGAALIALRGDALVVPVAIIGPYRLFHRVTITFGPPIDLKPYKEDKITSKTVRDVTARIMKEIEQLMESKKIPESGV